ncbi:hypothetical protein BUALT_Bualt18G0036900 [Buddleja alternifolia]|uniref:ubiquitinyl hydrolase 1 n=1 Tax=Buddleja alternifolia TaxID=168488 RepID=A0AAV6W7Y7_9LAMI|nr:hypothetical protein BUALT_Bualt18G0036900 [Buddleja alternifolia]
MGALQMTWQPRLLNKKQGTPPLGLRNVGNSCYVNSVLQCLTYTPPLANFCLRLLHSSNCDLWAAKGNKGECPFCILEKRIARSLNSESVSDVPAKINSCLRIYAEHFHTGRQEDAHEFLRYVVDACHNTCLRLKKLRRQQQRRGESGVLNGGDVFGTGGTVFEEIFGGALQSQVKCLPCGAESNKVDEIMDISLDILSSVSLKEALEKFFRPEVLDGNNKYKCDNCKELVAARKQMSILQAPNVLVIQLKRFEGMFGGKVDKPIAFDEILVLSSYMCNASQDPHPEYRLFGAIVHSGFSPDSGHYYAYIKDALGRWYCCNDSHVSVSTLQEVLSEKVYILFFSRAKQRPRAKVDLMVNGSKFHEYNGSKTSLIQKLGCPEKPIFTRQAPDHQSDTISFTKSSMSNGTKSFKVLKSGCLAITASTKQITASNSESNNRTNYSESNGCKTATTQMPDDVETPMSMRQASDSPKMNKSTTSLGSKCSNLTVLENSGVLLEQVHVNQSSNDHNPINSATSKVDQGLFTAERKLTVTGSTKNIIEKGNIKVVFHKSESSDVSASATMMEKEKIELPVNQKNGVSKKSENVQIPSSFGISNGKMERIAGDSLKGSSHEVNGVKNTRVTRKIIDCQNLQNGNIIGSSDKSNMKRKISNSQSCILLSRDDQSRARVEAFKESMGKEALTILRSCGWSDEVYKFMHATKRLCQEGQCNAASDHEKK